jgi:hypothetical protein
MKKNCMLRTALLSTVLALLTIVLMTPVASAHAAAPAHRTATATSQVPDLPNVIIIRKHHRSVFSATIVRCKALGLQNACFTVTNLTHKTQRVIWRGKVLATIPPGAVAGLATSGPNVTSFTLQANSQAVLIAIAS